ncbi:MAG TPA: hypothetical protein VLF40_02460 [Candidatus Saccharimonadales bacterium]|nr:hypothetical protein [Candidatus Saccharimonadales bacterium]
MGEVIVLLIFIMVLIWMSRVEIGIAKTNQSLKRIEKLLKAKEEEKK